MLASDAGNQYIPSATPSTYQEGGWLWPSVVTGKYGQLGELPPWARGLANIGYWVGLHEKPHDCLLIVPVRRQVPLWIAFGFLIARLGNVALPEILAPGTIVKFLPRGRSRFVSALVEGLDPQAPHLHRVRHLNSPTTLDSLPRTALLAAKANVTLEAARLAASAACLANALGIMASADNWLSLQESIVMAGDVETTISDATTTHIAAGDEVISLGEFISLSSDPRTIAVTRLVSSHSDKSPKVQNKLSFFNGLRALHLLEHTLEVDRGVDPLQQRSTITVVTEPEFSRERYRISDALSEANGEPVLSPNLSHALKDISGLSALILARREAR